MAFAFFSPAVAVGVGLLAIFVSMPFILGFLRDYQVLLSSLTAYGVSAAVCVALSWRNSKRFNFNLLAERVTSFDYEAADHAAPAERHGRAPIAG
jgi:hypothetical protein